MDKKSEIICPYCGSPMIWDNDWMSEQVGYTFEGKVVILYHCENCGATGEFVENIDDDENDDRNRT